MNINLVKDFIKTNQSKVIDLFLTYQMIEMLFTMKLFLPERNNSTSEILRNEQLAELNKRINNKTLGILIQKYKKKYPKDESIILEMLVSVKDQRNSFMHSLWMVLAAMKNKEEIDRNGILIINNYQESADKLFDKIIKLERS